MLSVKDNELLTRVGPGTPMGAFLREYWMPALLSSELPRPDSDPVRVLLLGEKLIAFRDTNGAVGLLDHLCPHRRAALFFGRNEEGGLRCVYHGWKFDTKGNCLDMPNEPEESDFRFKVKARAYPTLERGGVVWAYLGPRPTPPPLPDLAANMSELAAPFAFQIEGNYLQILEGDVDTTHAGFLHYGSLRAEDQPPNTFSEYQLRHRAAEFEVIDTEGGSAYGARRPASPGKVYWRIAQWCFPFYTFVPSGVLGLKEGNLCRVPMDDEHTMYFRFYVGHKEGFGADPSRAELLPDNGDFLGRLRTTQNRENDYLIDREVQRRNEGNNGFTGIRVVQMQDAAVQNGGALIVDRSQERLGSTDAMVIRVRRRLLAALRAHTESGVTPPGVDNPGVYAVRSGGIELDEGADWVTATHDMRKAGFPVPGLDPALNGPL